jgi:predicted nucleic acid-binding protein
MPWAPVATHTETLAFISHERLHGAGLGAVDVHLLASARLAASRLWTRDAALAKAAKRLGVHAEI